MAGLQGCRAPLSSQPNRGDQTVHASGTPSTKSILEPPAGDGDHDIQLASFAVQKQSDSTPELIDAPPTTSPATPLQLEEVIRSVVISYPLLESSYQSRGIAEGQVLEAMGAFDLKLKAESNNTPLGYYETYRQLVGLEQPMYGGGNLFAGYRIGRGSFEPWYQERQTNDGGEFKAGASVPLLQNRKIDARRAELWQSQWARRAVEPEIRADVLLYVYEASLNYWQWVAVGRSERIADELLKLALVRKEALEKQAETGSIARIELVDNERIVVSREAKWIEAGQKLDQAAIKLSLYLRNPQGMPVVPTRDQLPADFPATLPLDAMALAADVNWALENRPELVYLDALRRQLEIDLAHARNSGLPELDAYVTASQDVGEPTSEKRDKSPLELETGLVGTVPLQRRKAAGKVMATQAKLAQLTAKRRMAADKIVNEVENAQVALRAASERLDRYKRATDLANQMGQAERRKFAAGDSDLLSVNLREQQAAEAATAEIQAAWDYFQALAAYRAALSLDPLQLDANFPNGDHAASPCQQDL